MPLYDYQCECGEIFESLERMTEVRATCGELCKRAPPTGDGKVERIIGGAQVRGTGHDAKEVTVDLRKRAGRHWDDCC